MVIVCMMIADGDAFVAGLEYSVVRTVPYDDIVMMIKMIMVIRKIIPILMQPLLSLSYIIEVSFVWSFQATLWPCVSKRALQKLVDNNNYYTKVLLFLTDGTVGVPHVETTEHVCVSVGGEPAFQLRRSQPGNEHRPCSHQHFRRMYAHTVLLVIDTYLYSSTGDTESERQK